MYRKLIFRIARTELSTLFYSPVAWLLLVAFACQVGIDFSNILSQIVRIKALGNNINFSVTAGFVLGMNGIYEVIQETLYLYIPLLTMNLFSREYASGSIKLLYSSPVTSTQIVLGKYLAMVIFTLLFTVVLALPAVTIVLTTPHADIALILSGLLSMTLLMLTYCAIGLFMSALTSYQVVAAVSSLSLLALLNYIGKIGQGTLWIRDITHWLSIKGRASEMVGGLICSDDVCYFLLVIVLFLGFTVLRLDNERIHRTLLAKTLRYVGVTLGVVAVGYLTSRPAMMCFYDATYAKQRTLSEESQEVVRQLNGPLNITTYVDIFDTSSDFDVASPQNQLEDFNRFKLYTRFKPEIKMNYVYYYSYPRDSTLYEQYPGASVQEIAQEVARKRKCNPRSLHSAEELASQIDLRDEEYRLVRVVEWAGRQARLRLFNDMAYHPSETEISAALKKMLVSSVKVGVVTGHGTRSIRRRGDRDYSIFALQQRFRYSMINQGFDLQEVDLAHDTLSDSITILLIADLRTPLQEDETQALRRFVDRGGNLILLGDKDGQDAMNPTLSLFGVQLLPGTLVQPSTLYNYDLVTSRATEEAADSLRGFYRTMMRRPQQSAVIMPSAVALAVTDTTQFHPIPLLRTDSICWLEQQTTSFIDQQPTCDTLAGERCGSYLTAVAMVRPWHGRQQRILIVGDADCLSNTELTSETRPGIISFNFSMIPGSFRYLCYGVFPISSAHTPNRDTDTTLTPMVQPLVKQFYCFGIPALIALMGIIVHLRRRRN